jgi:cytochrome P450
MNNKELRDNLMIFILAGHDTTSLSLQSIFSHLAKYPHIQQRAYEEVKSIVGNNYNGIITYEQQKSMKYLDACINESIRLYPPIPNLPVRQTTKDIILDGHTIVKGTMISIDIATLHRDEKYWKTPHVFNPEHFYDEEQVAGRHRYAFQPFGAGNNNNKKTNIKYYTFYLFILFYFFLFFFLRCTFMYRFKFFHDRTTYISIKNTTTLSINN